MKTTKNNQGGFIKFIIIFIVFIIVIKYIDLDLRGIVKSPETHGYLGYIWWLIATAWEKLTIFIPH